MKCDKSFLVSAALGSAALLMMVFPGGCELDSAAQRIQIQPDTATLRYGESVTLTAYNGYLYDWSLEQETWGRLSSRQGMMVTYTSIYDPVSPAVQIITVTSTFSDDTGSGSSTGAVAHTAQAYITHIPSTSELALAVSWP